MGKGTRGRENPRGVPRLCLAKMTCQHGARLSTSRWSRAGSIVPPVETGVAVVTHCDQRATVFNEGRGLESCIYKAMEARAAWKKSLICGAA